MCPECAALATTVAPQQRPAGQAPLPRDFVKTGQRVGRYVVIECIGEGGMGVVYSAFDPELDRQVALKLLRPDQPVDLDPTDSSARLLREAKAMARLSHPNVVPVYDVGTLEGAVFIAMEFIRGATLSAWMRQEPRHWRDVLRAFVEAGRGLEAAHASGLVHRDFKPSNVLMGRDGRPRVTDFGVARFKHSRSSPSPSTDVSISHGGGPAQSLVVGTPGYMAPEQLTGAQASPAADQFAFCVSLYEGLYGELPFAGKTLPELGAAMMRGELRPPARSSRVPARIFRLLERGLSADPSSRFPEMGELLDALAVNPGGTLVQWAVPAVGALALLAAAVGLAAHSRTQANICQGQEAKLVGVWDAPVQTRAELAFAATKKPYASAAWQRARQGLEAYAQDWVALRADACRATRVRGEESEAQLLLRTLCLDRRLEDLGALARLFGAADGDIVNHATSAVEALPPLSGCANLRALADPRQALSEAARPAVERLRKQLADARALTNGGKHAAARQALAPILEQARGLGFAPLEAEAEEASGRLEQADWKFARAAEAYEKALRATEASGDDEGAARSLIALITVVGWHLGHIDEGRAFATIAEGVIQRLGGSPRLTGALDNSRGDIEWQAGRYAQAERWFRSALDADLKALGPESEQTSVVRSSLAWTLVEQGRLPEASEHFMRTRDVREALLGQDNPVLVDSWNDLAALYEGRGEPDQEADAAGHAVTLAQRVLGADNLRLVAPLENEATALADQGRGPEALELLDRVDQLLVHNPDAVPEDRAQALQIRSGVLQLMRHAPEAAAAATEGMRLLGSWMDPGHPILATLVTAQSAAWVEMGRNAEALEATGQAAAAMEKADGRGTVEYPRVLLVQARALAGLRRWEAARAQLEATLAQLSRDHGDPRCEADARFRLAQVLWDSGEDRNRARSLATEARDAAAARHDLARQQEMDHWLAARPSL
jgi:tetratricopeptide (TPR) repeat protein/predicted Ser/Thr protein kinase